MTIDKIFKTINRHKIKFIDLWFSDILGAVKNVTIPVREVRKALKEGIWFDGSSVEGFGRIFESDMYLKPDPNTFAVILPLLERFPPWRMRGFSLPVSVPSSGRGQKRLRIGASSTRFKARAVRIDPSNPLLVIIWTDPNWTWPPGMSTGVGPGTLN